MSYLVLHMDKFKKDAVRGIQNHNQRERKSHSNPDIDYEKSNLNYDLHNEHNIDFSKTITERIDKLDLKKTLRHDAVHMCGVVVSSDSEFFSRLNEAGQRRFFQTCKDYLSNFVGPENVISAAVHMDEKTPHMHFMHVPITEDGRLNANKIYTRQTLKMLQNDLPQYLQKRGFLWIERGVEQEPGSAKKHLTTREFKQQQEALVNLNKELEKTRQNLDKIKVYQKVLTAELTQLEKQAHEARKILESKADLPKACFLISKSAYEEALKIIELQKTALADRGIIESQNKKLWEKQHKMDSIIQGIEEKSTNEIKKHLAEIELTRRELQGARQSLKKMEAATIRYEKFLKEPEAQKLFECFEEREQAKPKRSFTMSR